MPKVPMIVLDVTSDVAIAEDAESALIYVKGFAVLICKTDSGVLVDVYAKGHEFCETLGRCQVSDSLGQSVREWSASDDEDEDEDEEVSDEQDTD